MTRAHPTNTESRAHAQATGTAAPAHSKRNPAAANGNLIQSNHSVAGNIAGVGRSTTAALNTSHSIANGQAPYSFTYGTGNGARSYRAYGYGNGYRNRSYGSRYGYSRSQGNNRAIIARLRSVHASLARIDHDYQGHRVRAMHAISMAIRQLSHQSMVYSGVGFVPGVNGGRAIAAQQNGAGVRAGRRQPMTQAQSDARMSRDLRVLQGINMQLITQGRPTSGHARASGHVQHAIQELHLALSIR
jgi:hypothetical protein